MARKPIRSVPGFRRFKYLKPEAPSPTPAPPAIKGWKQDWNVFCYVGLPALILLIILFLVSKARWRKEVDAQLSSWKVTYHLSDPVVNQLRMIEFDFHGSGNPITTPIKRTSLEIMEHHRKMALLMSKEDGENFLRDHGAGRISHISAPQNKKATGAGIGVEPVMD